MEFFPFTKGEVDIRKIFIFLIGLILLIIIFVIFLIIFSNNGSSVTGEEGYDSNNLPLEEQFEVVSTDSPGDDEIVGEILNDPNNSLEENEVFEEDLPQETFEVVSTDSPAEPPSEEGFLEPEEELYINNPTDSPAEPPPE